MTTNSKKRMVESNCFHKLIFLWHILLSGLSMYWVWILRHWVALTRTGKLGQKVPCKLLEWIHADAADYTYSSVIAIFWCYRSTVPHLWQFFGIPSRNCQPKFARQFGPRSLNCRSDKTTAAPKIVPIMLSLVRSDTSVNSTMPIATKMKIQNATNKPIVALWCRRNLSNSFVSCI